MPQREIIQIIPTQNVALNGLLPAAVCEQHRSLAAHQEAAAALFAARIRPVEPLAHGADAGCARGPSFLHAPGTQ